MPRSGVSFSARIATPADLDVLLPLVRELWKHEHLEWHEQRTPEALLRLLGDANLGRVWISEDAGRAVGYLVLCFGYSLEFYGRDAFIDELYVAPAYRNHGHGVHLIATVEAACAELGVRALHLEVDRVNERARNLYLRAGFRDHDRFLMTRQLR